MRPARAAEAELGKRVVPWLRESGWDVFEEVSYGGPRADIVATKGPLLAVVELKQGPSLDLVAQLSNWRGTAHFIAAATWTTRRSDGFRFVLRDQGWGWLTVPERDEWKAGPSWSIEPQWHRARAASLLRAQLNPGHQRSAGAGSARGGAWAPWRDTVLELARVATERPGITLIDAMARAKHHYSSSAAGRSGAAFLFKRGLVPGFRLEKVGNRLCILAGCGERSAPYVNCEETGT